MKSPFSNIILLSSSKIAYRNTRLSIKTPGNRWLPVGFVYGNSVRKRSVVEWHHRRNVNVDITLKHHHFIVVSRVIPDQRSVESGAVERGGRATGPRSTSSSASEIHIIVYIYVNNNNNARFENQPCRKTKSSELRFTTIAMFRHRGTARFFFFPIRFDHGYHSFRRDIDSVDIFRGALRRTLYAPKKNNKVFLL